LMDSVQTARVSARSAGFSSKTVRQPDVLNRQLQLVQNLVLVHATQGDFRSRDQAQVGVFQAIDLRLRSARDEADPLQHFIPCNIRGDDRRVSLSNQNAHRVLNQCQLQKNGVILQK